MLKGKLTHRKPTIASTSPFVKIPLPVLKSHSTNEIVADLFFVQKHIDLLMKSRVHKFHGANANCQGREKIKTSTVIKAFLKNGLCGISLAGVHIDNEFEKMQLLVAPILMQTRQICARN